MIERCPCCNQPIRTMTKRNEEMKRFYATGASLEDIAITYKLGKHYVRNLLADVLKPEDLRDPKFDRNQLIFLKFKTGERLCDLARQFQLSRNRIYQIIKVEARRERFRLGRLQIELAK